MVKIKLIIKLMKSSLNMQLFIELDQTCSSVWFLGDGFSSFSIHFDLDTYFGQELLPVIKVTQYATVNVLKLDLVDSRPPNDCVIYSENI